MPVMFDGDISDAGAADLVDSSSVLYVAITLTAIGPGVTPVDPLLDDYVLRAGFVSLGDVFAVGSEDPHDWWRAPIWINFTNTLWTPDPSTSPSGGLTLQATRVRWSLSLATTAHLHVFGA